MGNQMVTWPMTSRDPEMSSRDPNTLRVQYRKNIWRCYLETIGNYYVVCCEARQYGRLSWRQLGFSCYIIAALQSGYVWMM